MKHRLLIFFILIGFSSCIFGQLNMPDSLTLRFNNQLAFFPQEKIYLHTDKPFYITGEKIWFRAHLVEAASHVPFPLSRYVYVELFNPLQGSFSVSVTDDNAVAVDTTANILTRLLLTSDLRGNIEKPAAYFGDDRSSAWALDLLMMTQGWRRYDVTAVARYKHSKIIAKQQIIFL